MIMERKINTVLFIDDDRVTNFYNERVVSKHQNFKNTISVNSGKAALEYLMEVENDNAIKPDLIFLDINMPAMNGWEFIEEYKKLNVDVTNGIKIIMLTTSSSSSDFERYKKLKIVNDYINKPLSFDLLEDIVKVHYQV